MKGNDLKIDCTKNYEKILGLVHLLSDLDLNNIGLSLRDESERSEFSFCEGYLSSAVDNLSHVVCHFNLLIDKFRKRNYE